MPKFYTVELTYSSCLPEGTITVSEDILKQINLCRSQPFDLCAGNRRITVRCAGASKQTGPSLCVSDRIGRLLLLPAPLKLNLVVDEESFTLRLGSLIGIFANRSSRGGKPFGEQTSFFRKLSYSAIGLNSFCYAFGPGDIDWTQKVIRGSIPPAPGTTQSEWQTQSLPFPDVIYDRGLFQKGERRNAASEARKILRKYPGLKLFNPSFFGKWKTHTLLSRHEDLYHHLPETKLFTSVQDIHELLEKHGTVYAKPSSGSSGRGITVISTNTYGYSVSYRIARKVQTIAFTYRGQLESYLTKHLGSRRYIVQQGLNLSSLNGCPFDVRILMQKDRYGIWLRTGMAARVASPGNFISNIHAGGRAVRISTLLGQIFPNDHIANTIIQEIRRLSSLIVSFVASESNPLFGEIAVDLGIDKSGKVWIIELNAIPGRSVFRHIGAPGISARAISRPMEYAYFLSGFTSQQRDKFQEEENTDGLS